MPVFELWMCGSVIQTPIVEILHNLTFLLASNYGTSACVIMSVQPLSSNQVPISFQAAISTCKPPINTKNLSSPNRFGQKLEKYGVIGLEHTWFSSYLKNRRQLCRVNGVASNMEEIKCGVPQGSCLGPLLFLIYINDLPFVLKNSEVTMYADDTSTSHPSKNIDELNKTLNSDLDSLKQWLEGNKLSLNVIKTQAMVIGSRPNIRRYQIN